MGIPYFLACKKHKVRTNMMSGSKWGELLYNLNPHIIAAFLKCHATSEWCEIKFIPDDHSIENLDEYKSYEDIFIKALDELEKSRVIDLDRSQLLKFSRNKEIEYLEKAIIKRF